MVLHTKIGNEYLPEEVASPNRLTNYYESYVLIPNLGPLLYSRIYSKLKQIIADFARSIRVIENVENFHKKYGQIPKTPTVTEIIRDYGQPSDWRIAESINVNPRAATGVRIIRETGREITPESLEKSNEELKPLINIETARAIIKQDPKTILSYLKSSGTNLIKTAPIINTDIKEIERSFDYKSIISELSEDNKIISALVDNNLFFKKEGIADQTLLSASKEEKVNILVNNLQQTKRRINISPEIDSLCKSLIDTLLKDSDLSAYKIKIYRLLTIYLNNIFNKYEIVHPSDSVKIAESCEWAFARKEKITIDLKKPMFRGPLSVNCVAPSSELKLTESESRMRTSASQSMMSSRDDLKVYNSISSEVKNKLGILFDYGSNLGQTMSEQGYSQDNMQSEKRARVESALREISQQNSSFNLTSETVFSSLIREYKTEGKDPKYATSEMSFEVFSPVGVKHYLEDINAVWCPRIRNPFRGLRKNLNKYWQQTFHQYVLENYVIDPLEPIPSYENISRVSKNTDYETNPGTHSKSVVFELTKQEIQTGYRFGKDIRLSFKQHCDWYENCYEEDDYMMKIDSIERNPGDTMVTVNVTWDVADVTGNDPDRTYLEVSIDKFKETEAYRQELKQYKETVQKINPARRNAIEVQALKYANLKRDELIKKYESNTNSLKDFAFSSLIRKMFNNNISDGNWSYYQGIIRTCIDWDRSHMDAEPCQIESLYYNELSPYHFLNIPSVRFFMTLKKDAEGVFFDTMRKVVDPNWRSLFDKVEKYIKQQRNLFNSSPDSAKLLDSYDSEIVLGRHLEAVLSNKPFSE